jgi:hypothetical protein
MGKDPVAKLVELNEATVYNLAQQWSPLSECWKNIMVVYRTGGTRSSSRTKQSQLPARRDIIKRTLSCCVKMAVKWMEISALVEHIVKALMDYPRPGFHCIYDSRCHLDQIRRCFNFRAGLCH